MLFMPYDIESQSRNADFISIARKGDTTTLGAKGPVKLKNPPAVRPVNPKNLSLHNPSTQPAAPAAPFFTHISKCYAIHKSFHTGGSDEL